MSGVEPFADLTARFANQGERGVWRVSVDVLGEQVTFTRREGRVQAVCTCTLESCEHYGAALRFLGDEPRSTSISSLQPAVHAALTPASALHAEAGALADALDELCLASARAGASTQDSPSIRAALEQVTSAAPEPLPLSLMRFIGRFNNALALGDVGKLARLLAGAQVFVSEVRRSVHSREAEARVRAWLGKSAGEGETPTALTDVTLIEIGREWLSGLTRGSIERRYLVEPVTGEIYSEERRRGAQEISVGPCPRVVHVAFAELFTAPAPPRVRLLQYAVAPDPEPHWERLVELSEVLSSALFARYATASHRCPGLSEPVALFAPASVSAGSYGRLCDATGARLDLRDDQDAPMIDTLRTLVGDAEIVWVLGRLKGLSRGLLMRPISVLVRTAQGYRLRRVT